ncbi:MAG: pantetheine-phosphate adenylyltransferase [Bacteroidia bacterium]|nr:pantetheine-phosphate adenylyltransferase [Bacteroidia bacterium]
MKTTKAIYAFSGDPITLGHMQVIERALKVFGELTVGIGVNPAKKYLFTLEERLELAQRALSEYANVKVVLFRGLLVDYAFENGISVVIRGLRNSEDFNMELLLHQIGESQKYNIETIYFPSNQTMTHISSGAVKALQLEQGFVFDYVPLNVKQRLEEKLSGQYIIGVTGEIGSGKSWLCTQLAQLAAKENIPVTIIDVDKIGHRILESQDEPLYKILRNDICTRFGNDIKNVDGFIDRKRLGKIIFGDTQKLKEFNDIIYKPLLLKLRRELYGKKGLIVLDSALIAETNMTNLCNNNIILVKTTKEEQLKRLQQRTYTPEQIEQRINSQYSYDLKLSHINSMIEKANYGNLYYFNNPNADNVKALNLLFQDLKDGLMRTLKVTG